jgi:hypothetical protein
LVYGSSLKDLVNQHHPKDLLSLDEFLSMRKQVVLQTETQSEAVDDAESDNVFTDTMTDNDRPPGVDDLSSTDGLMAVIESSKVTILYSSSLNKGI